MLPPLWCITCKYLFYCTSAYDNDLLILLPWSFDFYLKSLAVMTSRYITSTTIQNNKNMVSEKMSAFISESLVPQDKASRKIINYCSAFVKVALSSTINVVVMSHIIALYLNPVLNMLHKSTELFIVVISKYQKSMSKLTICIQCWVVLCLKFEEKRQIPMRIEDNRSVMDTEGCPQSFLTIFYLHNCAHRLLLQLSMFSLLIAIQNGTRF